MMKIRPFAILLLFVILIFSSILFINSLYTTESGIALITGSVAVNIKGGNNSTYSILMLFLVMFSGIGLIYLITKKYRK